MYLIESAKLDKLAYCLFSCLLLTSLFVMSSCRGEEDDIVIVETNPCEYAYCGDHGTCVDGTCECEEYYTGAQCDELIVPISMTASTVRLDYIPKPCQTWDGSEITPGERPPRDADVYVRIYRSGDLIYDTRSIRIYNTDCTLLTQECYYNRSITLDPNVLYELRVYDYDQSNADDLMGQYFFRPWQYMSETSGSVWYPETNELQIFELNQSCSISSYSSSWSFGVRLIDVEYTL